MARALTATSLLGAALAFALPFGTVFRSCGGGEAHFTGVELATFSVPAEGYEDVELASEVETHGGPFAFAALAAAVIGGVLAVVGISGTVVCAVAGLLAMQLLLYAIAVSADGLDLHKGFGLSLAGFVAACVVSLVEAIRARRRRGVSLWPPVAWGLTAVLPPLGLILAGLVSAAVWCGRSVRAALRGRPASA